MMGARESGWRSSMKGRLAFIVVLAVVAVAAVQVVDFATRKRTAAEEDIAKLQASVNALASEVREVRGMLEAIGATTPAVRTGGYSPGAPGREMQASDESEQEKARTTITVYGDETYAIDGTPCSADEIGEALDALAEVHPGREVVVMANDASYEAVLALMKECEDRGLKIALAAGSSELGGDDAAGPVDVSLDPVDVLLEMDAARRCTLDGREVARDALKAELKKALSANPAMRLVVRAHETVPMSEVQELVAVAGEAGIYRIDAVTTRSNETPDSGE
jgi:biopolymer transport protein ExbD